MLTSDYPPEIVVSRSLSLALVGQHQEPGSAPIVNSFSGTFGQGNSVTLSGTFSAERNGQIAYITGDLAKIGSVDEQIVGFAGETTGTGYTHDNTRSFGKSGVSLLAEFAGNSSISRHSVRLPQRS